jgi:spore maturation protein SpmA
MSNEKIRTCLIGLCVLWAGKYGISNKSTMVCVYTFVTFTTTEHLIACLHEHHHTTGSVFCRKSGHSRTNNFQFIF